MQGNADLFGVDVAWHDLGGKCLSRTSVFRVMTKRTTEMLAALS